MPVIGILASGPCLLLMRRASLHCGCLCRPAPQGPEARHKTPDRGHGSETCMVVHGACCASRAVNLMGISWYVFSNVDASCPGPAIVQVSVISEAFSSQHSTEASGFRVPGWIAH